MLKKFILSVLIGGIFIYLSIRRVTFSSMSLSLDNLQFVYIIPIFFILTIIPLIRALRLKILFTHLQKVRFSQMFIINNIGYLFIMVLPLRLGELVIPYLMKNKTSISMSSAISVIFIERIIDFLVLISILFAISFQLLLPVWLIKSGIIIAVFLFVVILFILFFYNHSHLLKIFMDPILKKIPHSLQIKINGILSRLKEGFRVINNPSRLVLVFIISIIVWILSVGIIYLLFNFQGIKLGFLAAITVMVINVIGVSLPAGPGVIGNFQYSCIIALSIFAIDNNTSFIFSNVYYILGILFTIIIGLISLAVSNLSIREIRESLKNT